MPPYYLDAVADPAFWDKFWAMTRPGKWGCIDWIGRRNRGYGQVTYQNKVMVAHRLAWMMYAGQPVPDGMVVDHLCCFKSCVNPRHLEPVTDTINTRRWVQGVPDWVALKNGRRVHRSERRLYTPTGGYHRRRENAQ